MPDLWDRVKKTVTEIYASASERAVEGVNLGVKKLDEASLRRDLSREFAGLGGRTYQLLRRGEPGAIAQDPTIEGHMRKLQELERRLEETEREIQGLRGRGPEGDADVGAEGESRD